MADDTSRDRRNTKGRQRNRGQSSGQRQYSANAPSQRKRSADPARLTAFQILQAVTTEDAYANLILPTRIRRNKLDRQDAAFATELTYGTLRSLGTYDAILGKCVDRPIKKLDKPVLDALRLGVHQLLNMRVPDHAALDTTVALVRAQVGAGPSGLVNAVLRKVTQHTMDEWLEQLAPGTSDTDLSIRYAHPTWILRAIKQSLVTHGRNPDDFHRVLEANNIAPELNLIALPGIGDLEPVLEYGAESSTLAPDAAVFSGGDAGRIPGVADGSVRVQDIGSQLTARALAGARDVRQGEVWLDMSAGPGGKAAVLASLAQIQGATLQANDVSEHRTKLVQQALRVVDENVWTTSVAEGQALGDDPANAQRFDRILLDAPCTGLGALRRRPESRWRRTPQDLATLTQLQSQLLDAAVAMLKPGGLLAYVTCSPQIAETTLQVSDVMKRHPEVQLLDSATAIQSVAKHHDAESMLRRDTITSGEDDSNMVQLWPDQHRTDAMFFALLTR
ncbi:transcription antitermination factor NusB [Yaniella flava]|uniref:Transcription antitermination factor NusB n=1 Tax=Yaniella flava TaxID=287930 RepID=A0ABN2USI3_9MICC